MWPCKAPAAGYDTSGAPKASIPLNLFSAHLLTAKLAIGKIILYARTFSTTLPAT
jgi:hypothetical protein